MGGIIPRQIKDQVIRDWIDGYLRDRIAQKNGVGAGTVTNIVYDASKQAEYHEMPLFRHLALKLNENGLEPIYLALAIRIKKIMEENCMNVDQVDRILSEITTYCYMHGISLDGLIKSGQEAIMLQEIYGIHVGSIPERIVQLKKDLDDLADQIQNDLIRKRSYEKENLELEKRNAELREEKERLETENSLEKKRLSLQEKYEGSLSSHGEDGTYYPYPVRGIRKLPTSKEENEVLWKTFEERAEWHNSEPGIDLSKMLHDIYDHPLEYKQALMNPVEIYKKRKESFYI